MKKQSTILLTLVFLILGLFTYGQEKKLKKASQMYDQFEYIDATEIYLHVAEKGFTSEELLRRLSNGLFFNSKYEQASRWYDSLYVMKEGKIEPCLLYTSDAADE